MAAAEKTAPAAAEQTPAIDFNAWAAEAAAKAKANAAASVQHGQVIDPDPRLHYAVLDGDAPRPVLERHVAYHERLGFRHIPGVQVVGYRTPVVYAVPVKVYRDVIRAGRVAEIRERSKRFGLHMTVERPTEFS